MYKKLFSDTIIYGVGAIIVKSIAFFTLPIYTRIFSPEEFGIIEMFATISGILAIIMTVGLDSAHSFYFMEAKNKKNSNIKKVSTSILQLKVIIGVLVIGIVVLIAPFILDFMFNTKLPVIYLVWIAVSAFFTNLTAQSLEIFRLYYKPWHYILLSFIQTVVVIGFILYFSYYLKEGIKGYIFGMLIGSSVVMGISFIISRKYLQWEKIDYQIYKKFLYFGIPLIFTSLMLLIIQASDRWFIINFLGSFDTGIYAVGAKIALIYSVALGVFAQALNPMLMDLLHKKDGEKVILNIFYFYLFVGGLVVVCLSFSSKYIVSFLASSEYMISWKIIGFLMLTSYFYGFSYFSWLGTFKAKKTYLNNYALLVSAVINIVLNFLLIDTYKTIGVAFSSSISMLLSNILMFQLSNKYLKLQYNKPLVFIYLFIIYILVFYNFI